MSPRKIRIAISWSDSAIPKTGDVQHRGRRKSLPFRVRASLVRCFEIEVRHYPPNPHFPNLMKTSHQHSVSISTKLAAAAFLVASIAAADAATVVVTPVGVSETSDNTDWVTNGLATLNGVTSGVDWTQGGQSEHVDWIFQAGFNQGNLPISTEWPTAGNQSLLGYTVDNAILQIGPNMNADVTANGSSFLLISEVAPGAGVFSLNGVPLTATSAGQVLEWTTPASSFAQGDTLTFSSDNPSFSDGPIGFSATATVPEPTTLTVSGAAMLLIATARRRKRA